MRPWPKRENWSRHRRDKGRRARGSSVVAAACLAAGLVLGLDVGATSALAPSAASGSLPERLPTVIVALPQMAWREARSAEMPELQAIVGSGAVALMPVASPSDADPDRTWVTLGAGRAAVSASLPGGGLPGKVFQVEIAGLVAANERAHTSARPGLLGTRLKRLAVSTAVIAFGDWPAGEAPPSAAVLMDEAGRVDRGWVLEPLDMTPFGKRLDRAAVRGVLTEAVAPNTVVLLDLTGVGPPGHVDELVGDAAALARERGGRLIALTPLAPPSERPEQMALGFVVMWDPGRPTAGLLTSASTRWAGMVSAADFAPTVLSAYDAGAEVSGPTRSGMSGRVMRVVPSQAAPAELDGLDIMVGERYRLERTAAILYAIFMVALAGAAFVLGRWFRERFSVVAAPALAGALFPVGLLVAPLAGAGQARELLVAAVVAVGGALLAARLDRPARSLAAAMLVGAGVIAADVVLGSHLMRQSALGFSVASGSRFYGIGNEYVGVMGAMTAIGLGALLQESPRRVWLVVALGAAAALVVGAPWWGANWGGYVATVAGLMAIWALANRRRARAAVAGAALVLVGAAIPAALDLARPAAERSHIGAAAAALLAGELRMVADTVWRKVQMNWGLLRMAGGWWAAAPVALAGAWAVLRSDGPARKVLADERFLAAGLGGALVTALVAMVVNDSGAVSLATGLGVALGAVVFVGARGR